MCVRLTVGEVSVVSNSKIVLQEDEGPLVLFNEQLELPLECPQLQVSACATLIEGDCSEGPKRDGSNEGRSVQSAGPTG